MDISGRIYKKFLERKELYDKQHGEDSAEKQYKKGKLTARERIELLFDAETFDEIDAYSYSASIDSEFGKVESKYGDGVIIGHGRISGRLAFAYSQDFTVMGGSLGTVHAAKIVKLQELAL